MKAAARAARAAMAVRQVVAISRVEQGAEQGAGPFGGLVASGSEVGREEASVR